MQANSICFFRLLIGLLAFAAAGGTHGEGMKLVAQHIEAVGPRQWLGIAVASFVAATPVLAPVSQRVAARLRRTDRGLASNSPETEAAPAGVWPYALTDNFA